MKHFEIEITYKDGSKDFREIIATSKMEVATHIIADIRSVGYQQNNPNIDNVRYNEKGTKEYRFA